MEIFGVRQVIGACKGVPSLKLTNRTWKCMVGILLSYWDGLFSGAMLVSGRVDDVKCCLDVSPNSDRYPHLKFKMNEFVPPIQKEAGSSSNHYFSRDMLVFQGCIHSIQFPCDKFDLQIHPDNQVMISYDFASRWFFFAFWRCFWKKTNLKCFG